MRIVAVDPGGKRLGLAVGDDLTGVVTPLQVIPYAGRHPASRTIASAASAHGAEVVVLGLPTSAEGDETPGCARTHALAAALAEIGIVAETQPEHLSTREARRRAAAAGRRRGEPVDDLAACVILEDYLSTRPRKGDRS